MSFVSELPAYIAGGGTHVVDLYVREAAKAKELVFQWRPLFAFDAAASTEETVAAQGLAEAKFEYYGVYKRSTLSAWRDDWSGTQSLPRLIRISARKINGDVWPDLVVALEIDGVRFLTGSESETDLEAQGRSQVAPQGDIPMSLGDSGDLDDGGK